MKHKTHNTFAMLVALALFLVVPASVARGTLEKVAVSLHDGWFVQSSANTTPTGAQISTPGFSTAGWMQTSIPATPVGAQVGNGIFPSPYVGTNAQQIPRMAAGRPKLRYRGVAERKSVQRALVVPEPVQLAVDVCGAAHLRSF